MPPNEQLLPPVQPSKAGLLKGDRLRADILQSGLFDAAWYAASYGKCRDPILHYLCHGVFLGLDPNPLFSTDWYLAQYPNVAQAGINPLWHYIRLGAAEGLNPNPLFDTHWYVSNYPQVSSSGLNALAHYLEIGSRSGFRPNRCFDPSHYLALNPDVAAAGLEPLVHYLRWGQREARHIGPGFDRACYLQELSPTERRFFSARLMDHYLARGQQAGLRPNYLYDPNRDNRRRAEFVAAIDIEHPTILMISHDLGGGTDMHVRDLARLYRGRMNCLLLTLDKDGIARIALLERTGDRVLGFDSASQVSELLALIHDTGTSRIHVHHVLGINSFAKLLVEKSGLPFDLTVHDYYLLSPNPHLTGIDDRFVGEDLDAAKAELFAGNVAGATDLASWRRHVDWLVTKSERIIVPSVDVARRLTRWMGPLPLIICPHPDLSEQQALEWTPPKAADEPLRIVTIGSLLPHKGFRVVLEVAKIAQDGGLPLSFNHIGNSINDEQLVETGIGVTGHYAERHLSVLLAKAKPHLIWFPVTCPESFSYTLTAALRSGIPLVVPDLGSFPERVAGREWTWVCPWQTTPGEWAEFFVGIRARHFLAGSPPDLAPEISLSSFELCGDFYDRRYLEWAKNDARE